MRVAIDPSREPRATVTPILPPDAIVVQPSRDPEVWIATMPVLLEFEFDQVRASVEAGATLLLLGAPETETLAALAGVRAGELLGPVELFATVAEPSPLTARSIPEFAVRGGCKLLDPIAEVTPILTSSIRYRHQPVLVSRQVGRGVVYTSAFGADALATAEFARIIRRIVSGTSATQADPLGLAVVGFGPYGGMGSLHGMAANETAGLELVAAVDPEADRRKAAEAEFPDIATYHDTKALLHDDSVSIVVIATPPSSHAELAKQCLEAGKHVAVEKPLCLTVEEADGLLATSAANERMLTVHQNRRWDPDFLALQRAIDTGLLGHVFNVETFVGGFEHPCRAWHSERSISGGAIYDWGSHHLDWILLLMGDDPATVTTTRHKRVWHDITNDDQVRVRMQWLDGREAQFLQSDVAGIRPPKFYVQGTEATAVGHYAPFHEDRIVHGRGHERWESHHAEAPATLTVARYEHEWGVTETTLPPIAGEPWPFHRNVADHLLLGEPLAVDPHTVRRVIRLLETAQRSGDEGGKTIELLD